MRFRIIDIESTINLETVDISEDLLVVSELCRCLPALVLNDTQISSKNYEI